MEAERTTRMKIAEWTRRYLPCEIAGWAGQLGGAAAIYWLTGSYAAAVVAGTIGASAGYYATAYVNGVRWASRTLRDRTRPMRVLVANFRALRSIAIEFGPAEIIDSVLIRPVALYAGPFLLGNLAVGWIVGSIVADVGFYVLAIFSYERFKGLLAVRKPASEEVQHGSAATLTA
ncbi:MAG: hypothetical protein QOF25_2513 [Mycobacterium sp.]|nr:hypothetical protein [Mycobacterium sp.]